VPAKNLQIVFSLAFFPGNFGLVRPQISRLRLLFAPSHTPNLRRFDRHRAHGLFEPEHQWIDPISTFTFACKYGGDSICRNFLDLRLNLQFHEFKRSKLLSAFMARPLLVVDQKLRVNWYSRVDAVSLSLPCRCEVPLRDLLLSQALDPDLLQVLHLALSSFRMPFNKIKWRVSN
jgi:hypothetical protein